MPRTNPSKPPLAGTARLQNVFDQQRAAAFEHPYPRHQLRIDRLDRIAKMLDEYENQFVETIRQDFGSRSKEETLLSDVLPVRLALGQARKKLRTWMEPRRVRTGIMFKPGRGRILPQPVGVVGVIAPWNFPLQLLLSPMVTAIAAGNRVIAKPSELTPLFADAFCEAVEAYFTDDECAVVTGEVEVSQLLTSLPFDHIVFTGSTSVGRLVAQAAAANLTPVTLELGGKSPAIIDSSADLDTAIKRVVRGKLVNSGQICVAPDYLIVPEGRVDETAERAVAVAQEMYPTLLDNPDVTTIINNKHFERLNGLVTNAVEHGAQLYSARDEGQPVSDRVMPLTVLTEVTSDMDVMQDEIFGPILPILPAASQADAIRIVQSRPRPLALYWFGSDDKRRQSILKHVHAGGVTVNDTLLHVVQDNLPFGGVGDSGTGNYHGQSGFEQLSHMKSVFHQSRLTLGDEISPPYNSLTKGLIDVALRLASR